MLYLGRPQRSSKAAPSNAGARHLHEDIAVPEYRGQMTLEEATECLKYPSSGGIRHIVANEDGSFSLAEHTALSEPRKLEESLYDTIVVATSKTTTKPDGFLHLMQTAAAEPITLRDLIHHLIDTYRPPRTKKDPAMVIRIRTRDAYKMGYLRHVD